MTTPLKELDIVAIVPARGGSMRLPRKNVLQCCEPLLVGRFMEAVLVHLERHRHFGMASLFFGLLKAGGQSVAYAMHKP
jgi:hypothetical protein